MFAKKFTYSSDKDIESVYNIIVKDMKFYEFEYNILKKSDYELIFRCSRIPLTRKAVLHFECFVTINKVDKLYCITVKPNYLWFEISYMIMAIFELINIFFTIYMPAKWRIYL